MVAPSAYFFYHYSMRTIIPFSIFLSLGSLITVLSSCENDTQYFADGFISITVTGLNDGSEFVPYGGVIQSGTSGIQLTVYGADLPDIVSEPVITDTMTLTSGNLKGGQPSAVDVRIDADGDGSFTSDTDYLLQDVRNITINGNATFDFSSADFRVFHLPSPSPSPSP
jgi:hypothetical protein